MRLKTRLRCREGLPISRKSRHLFCGCVFAVHHSGVSSQNDGRVLRWIFENISLIDLLYDQLRLIFGIENVRWKIEHLPGERCLFRVRAEVQNGLLQKRVPKQKEVLKRTTLRRFCYLVLGRFLQDYGVNEYCFFNGIIDEVRICNTVRNDAWIRLCYENQYNNDLIYFK